MLNILQAEKESELAKMDQRFSRSDRRQDNDVQMDRSPHPSPKSSGTPCLDTMKKLKRIRGISRRTRLISVATEVSAWCIRYDVNSRYQTDTEEIHQEQVFEEKDTPQPDASPSSNMEDAIARGVEAALRRILIEKDSTVLKKRSPRKRKMDDDKIRREKAAELSCERDFLLVSRNLLSTIILLTLK